MSPRAPGAPLLLLLALLSLPSAATAAVEAGAGSDLPGDPAEAGAALREGNRLVRRGALAAAVEAYRSAGPEAVRGDPLLAYNLGTALHRLGELPRAVLWYRRAGRLLGADPWLEENLALARGRLADRGAVRRPPPRPLGVPAARPWLLPGVAAAVAWAALALTLLGLHREHRAEPGGALLGGGCALLALAALLWAVQIGADRFGPRPAVLLAPCGPSLPAGSEVWVRRRPEGGFAVHPAPGLSGGAGSRRERCPDDAVAFVDDGEVW